MALDTTKAHFHNGTTKNNGEATHSTPQTSFEENKRHPVVSLSSQAPDNSGFDEGMSCYSINVLFLKMQLEPHRSIALCTLCANLSKRSAYMCIL